MDETNTPTAAPKADLSKTTLVVLVLLTLVISVIGTWSVLNEVNSIQPMSAPSTSSGHVSLTLTSDQPIEKNIDTSSGKVALTIQNGGQ